jgi:hypothetical protein
MHTAKKVATRPMNLPVVAEKARRRLTRTEAALRIFSAALETTPHTGNQRGNPVQHSNLPQMMQPPT